MLDINIVFKFLSIETKRNIILHLYLCQCNDCCVTNIYKITKNKQANISKHLMVLKEKEIVLFQKDKRKIKYKLNPDFIKNYKTILDFIKTNQDDCDCK